MKTSEQTHAEIEPRSLLRPQRLHPLGDSRRTPWDQVGNIIAWPIAIGFIIHRLFILGVQATTTDDFRLVYEALNRFWHGEPIYAADYATYQPHYLYMPGATVLLSPIGWSDSFSIARFIFVAINALAIVSALAIFTRMFGYSLRSLVFPTSIVMAFWSESVTNTLSFGNINGLMLLIFAWTLYGFLHNQRWLTGVLLGILILIKPVFVVLLFIPAALLWWQTFIGAIAIPLLFNIVGWKITVGASDYLNVVVPFLRNTRDHANVSWQGITVAFGIEGAAAQAIWLIFALVLFFALLASLPLRRHQPVLWLTVASAMLLLGGYFLPSLGQGYYSMFFFPLFFSVLLPNSPARSAWIWISFFLIYSPDSWITAKWPIGTYYVNMYMVSFGWAMMIIFLGTYSLTLFFNAQRRTKALSNPHTTSKEPAVAAA
ncbi:MAG: glycosyltransferase family 87 protein [Corynebacterium sp.]|nr:glycosyltransferase family 87 protein [Corynebacterium sp.]